MKNYLRPQLGIALVFIPFGIAYNYKYGTGQPYLVTAAIMLLWTGIAGYRASRR